VSRAAAYSSHRRLAASGSFLSASAPTWRGRVQEPDHLLHGEDLGQELLALRRYQAGERVARHVVVAGQEFEERAQAGHFPAHGRGRRFHLLELHDEFARRELVDTIPGKRWLGFSPPGGDDKLVEIDQVASERVAGGIPFPRQVAGKLFHHRIGGDVGLVAHGLVGRSLFYY